ncbi:hypothetical protein AQUCO_14200011v1 [Aquilegia coerulea]|uniref:Protein FAR1-RELATED SEQUENCE n=1 Tax=Aquilegia coerulea TaxID=218851 RepID=A0A2G5C0Z1_AQUCA|nr:hypothetical protein AQUCO_14200011v1 [Aquilegia coerulea]
MVDSFGEQIETEFTIADFDNQNGVVSEVKKDLVAPSVGMEFDSYDDVYNFYNCYAKELGFSVRVRNSWCKKKNKEKYGAVLCCSSEGFTKKKSSTTRSRAETRTGCPAILRIKLVGNFRWKVTEVNLEHNHLLSPENLQNKAHKSVGVGIKRKSVSDSGAGVQTCSSNQENLVIGLSYEILSSDGRNSDNHVAENKGLELKEGNAQAFYNFFCRMQLISPNFFYLVDLGNEGRVGNVFWADARSRAGYSYFGDVVTIDSRYLANKYEVSCVPFVGLNHHGQPVLLGCGLLADETFESFVWLFKAWLTCMSGPPPFIIITDQCKTMRQAVMEVFPGARHCYFLHYIMDKAPLELRGVRQYEAVRRALNKAVYDSFRVDEFERTWKDMVEQCGVKDHGWLQMLYHDRRQWVPVFLKDFLFAGISTTEQTECMNGFFDGYLSKQTSLKEFLGKYESALEKKRMIEAREDFDSLNLNPVLKTKCCFELQMSKVYTKEIFQKFQYEVEELFSCFNTTQVHSDGPNITYIVKERREGEGNQREIRSIEVLHALSVLNYNGVEDIPAQYIVARWRNNFKRTRLLNDSTNSRDVNNQAQWYDRLYRCAVQIVEEGAMSQEHYKVALQALEESLNKVCLAEEIESRMTLTTTLKPCGMYIVKNREQRK